MAVINSTLEKERRANHPNMVAGIERVIKAMADVVPLERHPSRKFDGLTQEEKLSKPVSEILPEWQHFLKWQFKVETIGELLDVGWAPILAKDGIGRTALWSFTDAIRAVDLDWPRLVMDGHRHPARPKRS